ncbi:MAG: hypothetical protein IAE97_05585 [Chthoniobacterales bacterium]|nr:hypothetical protein [Chthoniobacterales bacterium]
MEDTQSEDRLINALVIIASTVGMLGILTVGIVITVMVSANFNILNWME